MKSLFQLLLLFLYTTINVQTIPQGYLLGATFEIARISNKLYKINPLTGESTVFVVLEDYTPFDIAYDLNKKIIYIFADKISAVEDDSTQSLVLVNPINGTTRFRTIFQEEITELYGLRVDSNTSKLYSLQMTGAEPNSASIVQINPPDFVAKTWVDISNVDGITPDSKAFFYNSTHHQYFVTLALGLNDVLVGVDVKNRKVISRISNAHLPSFLCYDNHTNAFYGMQRFTGKRGFHLVRFNPYNGSSVVLSEDFNGYEPSAGNCYEGYYFTMLILNSNTQNIVTFDLNNSGKVIANKQGAEYFDSLAFIPI